MKEGNSKQLKGDFTLGLVSSKFTLEGPIIKDKTSFIVSGRRTYIDLVAAPFINAASDPGSETDLILYFYDLNAKVNHKNSKKNRLYLSAYTGRDKLGVNFLRGLFRSIFNWTNKFKFWFSYGNITSTLRWNHLFNDKLFSNTTLTYSRYSFNTDFGVRSTYIENNESEIWDVNFGYISGIEDLGARIDFDYIPNPNHEIKFGASYTNHFFFPGETNLSINEIQPDPTENFSIDTTINFSENVRANEMYIYIEDNLNLTNRLKANVGFHIGIYNSNDTSNASLSNIYNNDNWSIQPRISARYLINDKWS